MRWSISNDSQFFFDKHGFVRFEEVVKKQTLQPFLNHSKDWDLDPESTFINGRDLWRTQPDWLKLAKDRNIISIAHELVHTKPMRLAYTQSLVLGKNSNDHLTKKSSFQSIINKTITLEKISCFQGITIGALVCLDFLHGDNLPDIFPKTPGEVSFFLPNTPLPLSALYDQGHAEMALLVYGRKNILYVLRHDDLHTHQLKKLGYVFGDRLLERTHPTVLN